MLKHIIKYSLICAAVVGAALGIHQQSLKPKVVSKAMFWDTVPGKPVSYIYAPGLTGSEILMGRYCPEYTAISGEKISWETGGHVIGQPHTGILFPDVNLRKPTCFTLSPLTAYMNGVRRDLFPLMERYFGEKYGITVVDDPQSKLTVANFTPKFAAANIGQAKDINALHKQYKKHIKKYPEMDVVLYGDSRGAATIFNFIALHKPEKVKAAVVEGIFDTVPHCIKHFLYEDKGPAAEERLHQILSFVMWKYRKDGINPQQCAEKIGDEIPLLLVTSLKDGLVPPQGTIGIYKRLRERGHKQVHLLVLKKSLHPAYMIDDPEDQKIYQAVVHAFYKQYNLPHNSQQAAAGKAAFAQTQPSVSQIAERYPLPVCELCR